MPRQEFSESFLSHYKWNVHGDRISLPGKASYIYNGQITTVAAAGNFDVTHRDNANVEALAAAKKVIIYLPNGLVSLELRFRYNGVDGDQHILEIFAASGVDFYRWLDTLTIDQGTQQHTSGAAGTGIHFIDVVSSAGEQWLTPTTEITTTNEMGGFTMNMHGYDRLWIVASTLDVANAGTTLNIDWKQL